MRVLIGAIAAMAGALAGCYAPRHADCELRCGPGAACPSELACGGDGFCRTAGDAVPCAAIGVDGGDGPAAPDAGVDAGSADAREPCTAVTPPAGCAVPIVLGDRCYASCSLNLAWDTARTTCEGAGGYLVTFEVVAENTAVVGALVPSGSPVTWIGLRQAAGQAQPNLGWGWVTTGDVLYDNWLGGQPNDADGTENGQEQCAAVSLIGGAFREQWGDSACTSARPFLCEW